MKRRRRRDEEERPGSWLRRLEPKASADICIISSRHVSSSRTRFGTFYMSRLSLAAARLFSCQATHTSACSCNEI